jgi:hypothetical protein
VKKLLDGQTVPKMQTQNAGIITKANVDKYKAECVF